jgi:alpha-ribazole phosphatase/probable phosphoglycerate mutase
LKILSNSKSTIVDLIRHGEPVGGRKYRGHLDDPLSEKGWQQMWEVVGHYAEWNSILSSPLLRCAEFSRALGARLGVETRIDERLKEGGFGVWEGKLPSQICADDSQRLFRFKLDPIGAAPEGAEALLAVHSRVGDAWRELLDRYAGQHVLVVTHAGVIRMLMAHVLGLPLENIYRIQVGNAALTRLQVERWGDEMLANLVFHGGRL